MKYLFANNLQRVVQLPGPDGKMVTLKKGERRILSDYFKRYVPKYLSVVKVIKDKEPDARRIEKVSGNSSIKIVRPKHRVNTKNAIKEKVKNTIVKSNKNVIKRTIKNRKNIVGRAGVLGRKQATEFSVARIKENSIGISNNIGVGILSFNRLKSLIHLIESIRKHTDLNKTTVFVSDESTDPKVWEWLQNQNDIVAFHSERGGIAVNTNRLLRCLSRFKYKLILNDDVEVLRDGWDSFYFNAMEVHKFKHFSYFQEGIYGAVRPKNKGVLEVGVKPHGAVMAIHDEAFRKVGYFDENFGVYGFEHVDYGDRIAKYCHNKIGNFDVEGSQHYFKIYPDVTSDPDKASNYNKAKAYYEKVKKKDRKFIKTSDKSEVPGVSCIIPFRDIGRAECIKTVVNNIKAQRYPEIQILLVEQDEKSKINDDISSCTEHILVKNWSKGQHFCKSVAFNEGVYRAKFNNLILHDADMLVRSDYVQKIVKLLDTYESAHIGQTVCYMEKSSTDHIVKKQAINQNNITSDRIVNYYEGGSFGIRRDAYYKIGGFCEKFVGYGCFTEKNFVITSDGLVDIADIKEDDFVLTHTGKYQRVVKKFIRHCNDNVFDIFIPGRLPIRGVTNEHPFLINNKWIKAEDLKVGMEVGFQPLYIDLVQYIDLNDVIKDDKSKNDLNISFYSDIFSWFVGLFLAEGCVKTNKAVYLYIHENEDKLLRKILHCIEMMNENIKVKYHYVKNGCREIRIFSSKLAKIVNAISPKATARTKVLAKWYIENLSKVSKIKLIEGLIDGDGDKQHGSKKRLVYTTGSVNLANIVSMIMNECGISHSFGIRRTGGFIENDYYSLTINRQNEQLFDVVGMIEENINIKETKFNKIYDIKYRQISEPVYNLEVEYDNSYVVNGSIVHNCEDTEFYKRMVENTRAYVTRSIDMFHLWHDRTPGWEERHETNKSIQTKMFKMKARDLVAELHAYLKNKYKDW